MAVVFWPSRDPIEESGGVNLYGMAGNNAIGRFDYLGLEGVDCSLAFALTGKASRSTKLTVGNGRVVKIDVEVSGGKMETDEDGNKSLTVTVTTTVVLLENKIEIQKNISSKDLTYAPKCIDDECFVECDNSADGFHFRGNDMLKESERNIGSGVDWTQKGCGTAKVSTSVKGYGAYSSVVGLLWNTPDNQHKENVVVLDGDGADAKVIGSVKEKLTSAVRYTVKAEKSDSTTASK